MGIAYIALGTNMGDRLNNINEAIAALEKVPAVKVIKTARIYETEPWGYENQNCFLNTVVCVETELSPAALLGVCLGIEAGMRRIRTVKNGPRIIDLDLILYDDEKINTSELKLPHPAFKERAFVLAPLVELLPDDEYLNDLEKCDQNTVWLYEE